MNFEVYDQIYKDFGNGGDDDAADDDGKKRNP